MVPAVRVIAVSALRGGVRRRAAGCALTVDSGEFATPGPTKPGAVTSPGVPSTGNSFAGDLEGSGMQSPSEFRKV